MDLQHTQHTIRAKHRTHLESEVIPSYIVHISHAGCINSFQFNAHFYVQQKLQSFVVRFGLVQCSTFNPFQRLTIGNVFCFVSCKRWIIIMAFTCVLSAQCSMLQIYFQNFSLFWLVGFGLFASFE